jgi:hypothetical protein
MIRACSISRLMFFFLLLSLFAQAANEPQWMELRSAHYIVVTDAGERRGRDIALRFEQMRTVFAGLLTKERLNESRPLTILAFADDKSYYQLAPLSGGQPIAAPGFFLSGHDQDFIVLNMTETDPWRAVARDFAHRLLTFNYPPAQAWFDDGLLDYFTSIRIDGRQVEIGGNPDLQAATSPGGQANQPAKSFTELLQTQDWMPLPDLFAVKHDPAKVDAANNPIYRAESWIVMHYLLHEKKLPETGAYFGLVLNQHLPVEDAIKQAYGMSSAQLEQAVKDYFHNQTALSTGSSAAQKPADNAAHAANASGGIDRFPVPVTQDDSTITMKPMPEPDARAIYAGVQLRVPERHDVGLKTLTQLATTATEADKKADVKTKKRMGEDADQLPPSAVGIQIAHRFLAWDNIERGQFEEGFSELGDAASLNQRDMWVRYYLSVGKYRLSQAKHNEILGLANMMLDLKAVLDWNAELADAYDLLAVARNAGGSTTSAMESERAAIGLSPRNETYLLHLAQIYVASKKYPAATALLERLKTSDNPQTASAADDLLSQMSAQKKYGAAAANAGATVQPKYEEQKSPFSALDEDANKRDAAANQPGTADTRSTKYVRGRLVAVDCSNAPVAILTVHVGSGTLKLRAADYKNLLLIGENIFDCAWRDRQVTANYKPRGSEDGDLVSLEMR